MSYNYITQYNSPNYTAEAACAKVFGVRRAVNSITIHHWDDPRKRPTLNGTVNWLLNPASGVSAHYVVEAGTVVQLVDDRHAAWAGGTPRANATSIHIELNPRASEADYATAAELISDLRRFYGKLPIVGHNHWIATGCPGNWKPRKLLGMLSY